MPAALPDERRLAHEILGEVLPAVIGRAGPEIGAREVEMLVQDPAAVTGAVDQTLRQQGLIDLLGVERIVGLIADAQGFEG